MLKIIRNHERIIRKGNREILDGSYSLSAERGGGEV